MIKFTRFCCKLMAIVITLTCFSRPMEVSAYGDENTELLSNYLAASIELELTLEKIGLKLSDFEFLNDVDETLLNDVIKLAKERYGEQYFIEPDSSPVAFSETSETSTDVKNFSDRLLYSMYIADVNKRTDYRARSIEDETIYMYLSHYIDTGTPYSSPTLDSYSFDGYFSAYITDNDRACYDAYIERTKAGRFLNDTRAAITSLAGLALSVEFASNAPTLISNMVKANDISGKIIIKAGGQLSGDVAGFYLNRRDFVTSISNIFKDISLDTPEEILDAVDASIELEDYDGVTKDAAVGLLFSFVAAVSGAGVIGVVAGVGLFGINTILMFYKDFYDYAAWLGLYSTNSARRADRYMRYIGWL